MAGRARTYCLDSWAVLRFLEGSSPAARRVRQVMRLGRPIMSWINVGEVHYTIHRAAGAEEAESTLTLLRPMLALDTVTPERVLAAARIKANPSPCVRGRLCSRHGCGSQGRLAHR